MENFKPEDCEQLCKLSTSSGICLTVSNSPNPLEFISGYANMENVFYCLNQRWNIFYLDIILLPWWNIFYLDIILLPRWNIFYLDIILLPWWNIFFLDSYLDIILLPWWSIFYFDNQWRIQTFCKGGGHLDPEMSGGGPFSKKKQKTKKSFWPFGPQFGLKIRGRGSGYSGPSPRFATESIFNLGAHAFNAFPVYFLFFVLSF